MKVLIVEDNLDMRDLLTRLLERDGYEIETAGDSATALSTAARFQPDLALLDVVLGREDGRALLPQLREIGDFPVMFVTARGLEMDRINGLRMGADDYIVKPFSSGELSARIENVMRRSRARSSAIPAPEMVFGDLRIDALTREVNRGSQLLELTTKEFDLLFFLASSPRQVFTRQQLLQQVWLSSNEWQDEATVTEHIRRLRRKIEKDPDHPRWINTVRGVGYRFEPSAEPPHGLGVILHIA
jgi:two-component system, OmpR family, phosphate regulon response regulator PhoB